MPRPGRDVTIHNGGGLWCLVAFLLPGAAFGGTFSEVKSLPGWSGKQPSRTWSGYADGTPPGEEVPIHTHYWLLESEGDNPDEDPLIVWTNGGPGASSMFGLLVELGPLLLSGESLRTADFNKTGIPTLFRNEFSWTKLGNVLIYNAPAPVGFSYCGDRPDGSPKSCGTWDDTRSAASAHAFLRSFMADHPVFKGRDVYITGESYAGIYVPTLAREILSHPGPDAPKLKGIAVGDGCVGSEVNCFGEGHGPLFLVEFLHGHQQFSEPLYAKIRHTCADQELAYGVKDPACAALLDEMDRQVGGYFAYALYDDCTYENGLLRPGRSAMKRPRLSWREAGRPRSPRLRGSVNDYPCGGGPAMDVWVNQSAVRKALHVPLESTFYSFDNGEEFTYLSTERSLLPFYKHVAQDTPLRVLIYNGDTDPGLNTLDAQNWTRHVGLRVERDWRPWTLDGRQRMGGYVTDYEGNFSFLTVRGAGHMVPEYKPAATFEFLQRWLRGEPFKPYVPPRSGD